MARIRSPNYPSISLSEALTRIAQVHERERQHPAAREVIMKGMGYGGVNGASLGAISAALKYGLLERIGKSEDYKVSDRAVTILHPHGPEEKEQALNSAARSPALFSELLDHFRGSLPSDDNLRAYLVRRGFSKTSLASVIQSFRETMELVSSGNGGYIAGDDARTRSGPTDGLSMTEPVVSHAQSTAKVVPSLTVAAGPLRVLFNGNQIEVAAVLDDPEAVDKLIAALNANKALLPIKRKEDGSS